MLTAFVLTSVVAGGLPVMLAPLQLRALLDLRYPAQAGESDRDSRTIHSGFEADPVTRLPPPEAVRSHDRRKNGSGARQRLSGDPTASLALAASAAEQWMRTGWCRKKIRAAMNLQPNFMSASSISRGYKSTSDPVEYELHGKTGEQHPHDPAGNVCTGLA
jgi:hypothetical protein